MRGDRMRPTLENALARIVELENRVARLEKIVIGRTELRIHVHSPEHSSPTTPDIDLPFPDLDSKVIDERLAAITKCPPPETLNVTSALEEMYPQLAERIVLLWGNTECDSYL